MSRTPRTVVTAIVAALAGLLTCLLTAAPATAAVQVVRIANPNLSTFATASLADDFVRMQPLRTTDLQRWTTENISPTVGTRVVNIGTHGCLAVSPTIPIVEGSPVVQRPCINHSSELWRLLVSSTNQTVQFVNAYTGMCMTIDSTSSSQMLRQFRCSGSVAQLFRLVAA
jgi:hypothetical protein